jgi:hypothetical protein
VPGELYTQELRAGVETTYGTAVTPTRRLYFRPGAGIQRGGTNRMHDFLTGDRNQRLEGTPGPQEPVGSYSLPVSSDEGLEILRVGLNGTPTITTPGGTTPRLHTYVPGALASMTLQWMDGARPWQGAGVYANTIHIAGSANGENIMDGELFGATVTQTALSGSVTARNPAFFEGWETALFIEALSGADNYGTTAIAAAQSVINWDVTINNNLGRKFTAANVNAMQAAIIGALTVEGSVTFEAAGAQAMTEYNNFVSAAKRRMRLRFGNNDVIETTFNHFFDLDIPLVWTSMNLLAEDAGTRTYEAGFSGVLDSVTGFSVRIRAQNARTVAF